MRRSHVASEELAQLVAPPELMEACAKEGEGEDMPRGQTTLSGALKEWVREKLGKG